MSRNNLISWENRSYLSFNKVWNSKDREKKNKSLIIHHPFNGRNHSHQRGWYRILISIELVSKFVCQSVCCLFLISIHKIYETHETGFYHISKQVEVTQKYFAVRGIFDSLSVLENAMKQCLVFDILFQFVDSSQSSLFLGITGTPRMCVVLLKRRMANCWLRVGVTFFKAVIPIRSIPRPLTNFCNWNFGNILK